MSKIEGTVMNKKSDLGESLRNGWSDLAFKYNEAFSIIREEYEILGLDVVKVPVMLNEFEPENRFLQKSEGQYEK